MMLIEILVVVAFVLGAFFPLNYRRSKWRKYGPGKALMLFGVIVALVLAVPAWRVLFGPIPTDVRMVTYILVIIGLLVLNGALLKEQRSDRKKSRAAASTPERIHP